MQGKKVSESVVTMQHAPMPDETNLAGSMHGGNLLKLIDTAGGIAACRHSRTRIVTASIERMDFLAPIYLGELLTLRAYVNLVGTSSLDVSVYVEAENLASGAIRQVGVCHLTYVAVDKNGRPMSVPPLIIAGEEEERRRAEALERRRHRASLKNRP